jgi:hypothetical protein
MTTTATRTLQDVLNDADLNQLSAALYKVQLGELLEIQEYDTGTITATADVTIPGGALLVQSARVVTSGTAASVGCYLCADSGATAYLPTAASQRPGVAVLNAAGTQVTFPNTVTRAVIRYIKKPANAISGSFV